MKFSVFSFAIILSLGLSSSSRSVQAVCDPGADTDTAPLIIICNAPSDGPDGFTTLCDLLSETNLIPVLDNPDKDFTLYAPTNQAFTDLAVILCGQQLADAFDIRCVTGPAVGLPAPEGLTNILLYHIIDGSILSVDNSVCTSRPEVAYGGKDNQGKLPKIRCAEDILGGQSSFIVGPGNKSNRGNLPRLSRNSEVVKGDFCNGIVYVIDNVILPSFVAKKLKLIESPDVI